MAIAASKDITPTTIITSIKVKAWPFLFLDIILATQDFFKGFS
jgi:hypothetical protein